MDYTILCRQRIVQHVQIITIMIDNKDNVYSALQISIMFHNQIHVNPIKKDNFIVIYKRNAEVVNKEWFTILELNYAYNMEQSLSRQIRTQALFMYSNFKPGDTVASQ